MMTSFNASRWSVVFFVSYISINLYFLLSLMLAVVYDAFTRIEKDKFRRLLLHKRRAAQHAFKLLVTRDRPDEISFQHFAGLLKCYRRRTCKTALNVLSIHSCWANILKNYF
jgi:two pore calcium channel protein 1